MMFSFFYCKPYLSTYEKFVSRVIKRKIIIAKIKRMQSRDKNQTWKRDTHNKEYKITKIIHTK